MDDKILSSKEKKDLLVKVKKLKKKEMIQIFKIIKESNNNFSENSNGIFVNLNKVDNKVLLEIKNLVDICYQNNEEYDERKKQMEKFYEDFEKNNNFIKNVEDIVKNEEIERESKYNKEIKNNKKLSSLEKAIVRNSVNKDINDVEVKTSIREFTKKMPKYTGSRARILKTCKELNKSICYSQNFSKPEDENNQEQDGENIENNESIQLVNDKNVIV